MNEDKTDNNPIPSLRTLEGDLLASMKNENYSSNIVKIVTQDKNGGRGMFQNKDTSSGVNGEVFKKYLRVSAAVLVCLGAILFYTINLPKKDTTKDKDLSVIPDSETSTTSTDVFVQPKTIFEADIVVPISISGGNKIALINKVNEIKQELSNNKVANKTNISFIPDISLEGFFDKIQYSGPGTLLRSLSADKAYNFGVYHIINNEFETYLLVKTDIFDLGFSGMLEWEKNMPVDLEKIFVQNTKTATTTSTSSLITSTISSDKFTDKVIKNVDTRTYFNKEKGTQITYGFINKQYLLITSGENSFVDILNKLLVKNVLR